LALTVVVRPWAKFFAGFLAMAWVNMGLYPFEYSLNPDKPEKFKVN
jgi:hypothetical protein